MNFFPQVSLTKPCVHLTASLFIPHAPRISSFWFDHPNNIWWGLQIMELLTMQSFPLPCYLFPLGPNIFLSTIFSNTLRPCSFFIMTVQVLRPHITTDKIIVQYIFICLLSWRQFLFGRFIQNIWRILHFQRIYYLSLFCDIVLPSVHNAGTYTQCRTRL